MTIIGYCDRRSVLPGEVVRFMVSTDRPEFSADVVRLQHGDRSGPGLIEHPAPGSSARAYPGVLQPCRPGAYVVTTGIPAMPLAGVECRLTCWISPNTPRRDRVQGLLARAGGGWSLCVEPDGRVSLRGGPHSILAVDDFPLRADVWYRVEAVVDGAEAGVAVTERLADRHEPSTRPLPGRQIWDGPGPILIGARRLADARDPTRGALEHFNGKIAEPEIRLRQATFVKWRLGRTVYAGSDRDEPAGETVTVNLPVAGVTGPRWDSTSQREADNPSHYNALEFHENSLGDAGWSPSVAITIPADWRSGVYALRISAGPEVDRIPFFVRAAPVARARIAVLLPTLTYLAYANERMHVKYRDQAIALRTLGHRVDLDECDRLVDEHPEWGLSTYDEHPGGIACTYSSWHRPIPNLRPTHRMWATGAARHLGGDLYLIDWLDRMGFEYDVLTDEDLHHEGTAALAGYDVLLTGAHPEYATLEMLRALEAFCGSGGRCMYLGGNGFYWVAAIDARAPHVMEVRRGRAGTRTNESRPGELYLAATGELGGLWADRGLPPHRWTGVRFAAQGFDRSCGYVRRPDVPDSAGFVFDGISEDEMIGDFGLVMGGAAGDEVDCTDGRVAAADGTIVLAESERFSRHYLPAIELFRSLPADLGDATLAKHVRAEMTLRETRGGGAVFAVGSVAWTGALSHNDYSNNVSRITGNVLTRFLARDPLGLRGPRQLDQPPDPDARDPP